MNPKKITYDEFLSLVKTEVVYLYYGFENAVLRVEPTDLGVDYFLKFKGEKEFKAERGSGIVAEAQLPPYIITRSDYDNF